MSSGEIFALRKQKRYAEALGLARSEYPQNTSDVWFLRAYAWALYDHVKEIVDRYEAKQLSPAALSGQLSPYMREFSQMADALRGDSAFSQFLRLAGKVSKDWAEFLKFARWVGNEHFSDEDKKPFINEAGKTVDSLHKRFIRAVCRETAAKATDPQSDQALNEWGLGVLDQALQDEPNDQWLNYYQSKLHLANGEPDLAIKRLTPVLRRQSRAAWPWALLGEILEVEHPQDALTCYAHATQLAREEQEVAKVRIHLAQRLALAGRFNEAAHQANLALQYREQHTYKVPQELHQLLASDWYQQALANNSLQPLPKAESSARALLQQLNRQTLTYTRGVIDHINTEKALSYVATGAATGFGLLHNKFPAVADLLPGTVVEIGRAEPDGHPVDWRLSEDSELAGLCQNFTGNLVRQEGKDFAFVRSAPDDIFVPPMLAKNFGQGQTHKVSCLAIRRTNKQGKTGWRAVKVNNETRGDHGCDQSI
ncbi:DUF7017 domain-containing protein [Pseudomonas guariconensis]|uniref:DUF7017 domain-containing protein n=1 Tax=Pseudomonas guariconensis TaxID=1288410 RepID=UPI0039EB342A